MGEFCTYCNTLHRAFSDANYCSIKGDELSRVRSNAYYFQSNDLDSGDHISRLSIRTINRGYQNHFINGREYLLNKDRCLIVPEGASFESQLKTINPIEGLLVAYSKNDISHLKYWKNSTDTQLLDNPFEIDNYDICNNVISFDKSYKIYKRAEFIQYAIKKGLNRSLYYEEQFLFLLRTVLQDIHEIKQKVKNLKAKKNSTKKEIYKRISRVKDYIDCNLKEKLDLKTLSQISTMSPFHLLRNFQSIYGITPHQYVSHQRLEKAKFLLKDTHHTLDKILSEIGLENKSSFTRYFKNKTGFTTSEYQNSTNRLM